MATISTAERQRIDRRTSRAALRFARRQNAEIDRARQPGVRESVRVLSGMPALIARDPGNAAAIVADEMRALQPTLADAMTASALVGMRDEFQRAKPYVERATRLSVYDQFIIDLRRRLAFSPATIAAIRAVMARDAAQALTITGLGIGTHLDHAVAALMPVTAAAAQQQLTIGQATKALKVAAAKAGITTAHDYALETLYRTQMQISLNAGRWAALQTDAVQSVLWGYEYVAVGDDRTRPNHLRLHGTKLPKDDARWEAIWPPNGWNCRCAVVSLFAAPAGGERVPLEGGAPDKGWAVNFGQVSEMAGNIQNAAA